MFLACVFVCMFLYVFFLCVGFVYVCGFSVYVLYMCVRFICLFMRLSACACIFVYVCVLANKYVILCASLVWRISM